MNIPIIANCTMNYPRAVSPQIDKSKQIRDKSPLEKSPVPTFGRGQTKPGYSPAGNLVKKQTTSLDAESFRVYVRARPVSNKELSSVEANKRPNIIKKEDNMIFVFNSNKTRELRPREEKSYVFDDVFDENDTTDDLYRKALVPALDNVLNGYNSTILAYGMTGAGKTHTMFGDIHNCAGAEETEAGVITLMVKDLLNAFTDEKQEGFLFQMKFSYLEIYNEQIRDLLSPQPNENLMIIEDPNKGIIISNLSSYEVNEYKDILELILLGNSRRVMASTNANQFSSRSHAILQITVEKRARARDIIETYTQSKLCLVDLAGSERAAGSDNRGIRQMEGANINRSLLALGNCINVLSDPNNKGAFVPYRDSKLTRLLKDSLGGNTKTMMVACISPFYMAYEETINTLKYASHARKIKKKVVKNVKEVEMHVSQYKDIIESLKGEIDILKKQLLEKMAPQQTFQKSVESAEQGGAQMEVMLDALGNKLVANLEENCELNQSYKELKELKSQNEAALNVKIKELEKSYNNTQLFAKLSQEIISLKTVMENNEVIEKEVEENLKRNLQEKKALQDRILQVTYQHQQSNQDSSQKNVYAGNERGATKNATFGGNRDHAVFANNTVKKDEQISTLEKYIQDMQRKLAEKDKQLAHNQQIISLLCQKNETLEAELTADVQVNQIVSARSAARNQEGILSKSQKQAEEGTRFSFQELCDNSFGDHDNHNKEKSHSKNMAVENVENLRGKSAEKVPQNNLLTALHTEEADSIDLLPGILRRNKTSVSIGLRESPVIDRRAKKVPLLVSIAELKKDAEKLREIDLEHVQKKFDQKLLLNNYDKGSLSHREFFRPPPVQISSFEESKKPAKTSETEQSKYNSNQSTNRNTFSNEKRVDDFAGKQVSPQRNKPQEEKMPGLSNFSPFVESNTSSELSCIIPQANEPSLDKDSLLDIYVAVKGESPQLMRKVEENPLSHNNPANLNNNAYPPVAAFNAATQEGAQAGNFNMNNYQLNNYRNGFRANRVTEDNFAGQQQQQYGGYANQSPNSFEPSKPNQVNTQRGEESGSRRSSSMIRNLGMAREFTKSFRMRLNNLIQAAESNMLNKTSIQEITLLVQDYNNNKNYLTTNDFMMLRNLGALALQKVGEQERKEAKKTPPSSAHQANTRSASANSRARNNTNASIDTAIQNQNKSPLEVRKKSPETESKSAKKVNPNNQAKAKAKAGILSNINSDYSKALNKFCKTQKGGKMETKQSAVKSPVVPQNPSVSIPVVSKSPNEYYDKERGRYGLEQSRKRSPNEFKELNSRENQNSGFEVSNFEVEGKQSIIDQNGAQMKMKMKNIRDKFEQIQKQNALKNAISKDVSGGTMTQQSESKLYSEQTEI